jgi:hypothetical protein
MGTRIEGIEPDPASEPEQELHCWEQESLRAVSPVIDAYSNRPAFSALPGASGEIFM